MVLDRRQMMASGIGLGVGLAAASGPRVAPANAATGQSGGHSVMDHGVRPHAGHDQTASLQKAIDAAARDGVPLHFPAGEYHTGPLTLPSNCFLSGVPGQSVLSMSGHEAALSSETSENIRLAGLVIDGSIDAGAVGALLTARDVTGLFVTGCRITGGQAHGVSLDRCLGRIADNEIAKSARAGLFCNDSRGLDISHNHVHDCGDNGIQVWRSSEGEDGTIVANNRVESIRALSGGSGQNGNGINVFRAGNVQVTGNRVTDCTFSAVRGNAASNLLVTGNSCSRLGEVAIYAEFGFEGAVIASNIVDGAASGISITNFDVGGRMAVAQGNLIRNLSLRDGDRGVGIAVEADCMVSGNVIEGAPGGGIMIGWGRHQRDVSASANLIRDARIGIGVSVDKGAGYVLITNNMISGTRDGAIRAMDHDRPLGPDLAHSSAESYRNIAVFGNVSL